METIDLQDALAQVAILGPTFGGLVYAIMAFVVKPLTVKVFSGRRKLRATIGVALSVILPVVYLVATHAVPLAWALPIAAIAFGSSWATNARTKANEAQ